MQDYKKLSRPYECSYPYPRQKADIYEVRRTLVDDIELLRRIVGKTYEKPIAGDTETTGLVPKRDKIVGFSFAINPWDTYYVPLRHLKGNNCGPEEEAFELIKQFHYRNKWLYFNWTFDGIMWAGEGFDLEKIKILRDVRALVFNADTNIKRNNLKWATKFFGGRDCITFDDVLGEKNTRFDQITPDQALEYAGDDAANTYYLWVILNKALTAETVRPGMRGVAGINDEDFSICALDTRLACVMAEYYLENEIFIDPDAMKVLGTQIRKRRDELTRIIMDEMGLTPATMINLGSSAQVADRLRLMGIDTGGRTETGAMAMDKRALLSLRQPIGKHLVEYSSLTKQLTSYVKKLSVVKSGRINYKLFNTPTGRLASGKEGKTGGVGYYLPLNYQNLTKPKNMSYQVERVDSNDSKDPSLILGYRFIPVTSPEEEKILKAAKVPLAEGFSPDMNVRQAITVPNLDRTNWLFVSYDYVGEEIRLIGGFSRDEVYMHAFNTGEDLYKTIGSRMFGVPYEQVTGALRKKAKIAVLGLNYGGSAFTIQRASNLPREECEEIERSYRKTVRGLEGWKDREVDRAKWAPFPKSSVVYTAWGRPRRLIHWTGSPDPKDKGFGKRSVVSHTVQGTAADVMRIILCDLYDKVFKGNKDRIQFIGCVHDEIDLCVRKDSLPLLHEVCAIMTKDVPGCAVNLPVDASVGYSYGHLFPFDFEDGEWKPKFMG